MSDASTASAGVARPGSQTRLAILALIVAAFAIACSPIFARLSEIGPTSTALYRTTLGLPLLGAWWLIERRRTGRHTRLSPRDFSLLWVAGFCFAGDLIAWHWSIHFTVVANATLLANLAPIAVTIGAWYLFKEKITQGFVISLIGAVSGSLILASGSIRMDSGGLGDALALVTALFYAGYFLSMRSLRHRLSTATVMGLSNVACSLCTLPIAIISHEALIPPSAHGWAILIALAMISQILGQTLVAWALAHLPVSYSAISLLLQPVISIVLAWAVLGEPLTIQQSFGGTIIMLSIIAARRSSALPAPS